MNFIALFPAIIYPFQSIYVLKQSMLLQDDVIE